MTSPRSRSEHGQAMVELALLSIVLIYLVMGTVDFGRLFFSYITVTQAAKDGARKGAAYPNCRLTVTNYSSISTGSANTTYNSIDYAVSQAGQRLGLGTSNGTSTITVAYFTYNATTGVRASGTAASGGQVDVTVGYTFTPITPLVGPLIGSTTVSATATHLIEAAPSAC